MSLPLVSCFSVYVNSLVRFHLPITSLSPTSAEHVVFTFAAFSGAAEFASSLWFKQRFSFFLSSFPLRSVCDTKEYCLHFSTNYIVCFRNCLQPICAIAGFCYIPCDWAICCAAFNCNTKSETNMYFGQTTVQCWTARNDTPLAPSSVHVNQLAEQQHFPNLKSLSLVY